MITLEQLRLLEQAADRGPWRSAEEQEFQTVFSSIEGEEPLDYGGNIVAVVDESEVIAQRVLRHNMRFIVAAVQYVRELLAAENPADVARSSMN